MSQKNCGSARTMQLEYGGSIRVRIWAALKEAMYVYVCIGVCIYIYIYVNNDIQTNCFVAKWCAWQLLKKCSTPCIRTCSNAWVFGSWWSSAFTACECNFDRGALCQLQACEDMLWIEPAWDDLPLQEQQGVSWGLVLSCKGPGRSCITAFALSKVPSVAAAKWSKAASKMAGAV